MTTHEHKYDEWYHPRISEAWMYSQTMRGVQCVQREQRKEDERPAKYLSPDSLTTSELFQYRVVLLSVEQIGRRPRKSEDAFPRSGAVFSANYCLCFLAFPACPSCPDEALSRERTGSTVGARYVHADPSTHSSSISKQVNPCTPNARNRTGVRRDNKQGISDVCEAGVCEAGASDLEYWMQHTLVTRGGRCMERKFVAHHAVP